MIQHKIQEGTVYIVQSGDSLFSIAQQAYGDGELWRAIYNANIPVIGSDPDAISPGMEIFIPILENTRYVVQKGDTLFSIAQQAYGNGNLWSAIYNANRTAIVDPDAISPGMKLSIPKV